MEINIIKRKTDTLNLKKQANSDKAPDNNVSINYNKIIHPKEILGRSSVNFTSKMDTSPNSSLIDRALKRKLITQDDLKEENKDILKAKLILCQHPLKFSKDGLDSEQLPSELGAIGKDNIKLALKMAMIGYSAKTTKECISIDDNKNKSRILDSRMEFCDFIQKEGIKRSKRVFAILKEVTPDNIEYAKLIAKNENLPLYPEIFDYEKNSDSADEVFSARCEIYNYMYSKNHRIDSAKFKVLTFGATKETLGLSKKIIDNLDDFSFEDIFSMLKYDGKKEDKKDTFEAREQLFDFIKSQTSFSSKNDFIFFENVTKDNIEFLKAVLSDKDIQSGEFHINGMLNLPLDINKDEAKSYFDAKTDVLRYAARTDKNAKNHYIASVLDFVNQDNSELAKLLISDLTFPRNSIADIIALSGDLKTRQEVYHSRVDFYNYINNRHSNLSPEQKASLLTKIKPHNIDFAKALLEDKRIETEKIPLILSPVTDEKKDTVAKSKIYSRMLKIREFNKDNSSFQSILINTNASNYDFAKRILSDYLGNGISTSQVPTLIKQSEVINLEQIQRLISSLGAAKSARLLPSDLTTAVQYNYLYQKEALNTMNAASKREFLKGLLNPNFETFGISAGLKRDFPLLPVTSEEYCALLPKLIESLGIKTKALSDDEISEFNNAVSNLAGTLASMSDSQFNRLKISQTYPLDNFIQDTLTAVKDLDPNERNKVFDYYGFELHKKGRYANEGFYLTGYPRNPHNHEKLHEISNHQTRKVIRNLKPFVNEFTKNNHIKASNSAIEQYLNTICEKMPELHTMIQKQQHCTHSFDLIKHTLKVMQKVASDKDNYDKLDESDKRVILLATLLHDIAKTDGKVDYAHPENGSFDAYFIAKKLNLPKDEELKLYTIIRNHEWLKKVNFSTTDYQGNEIKEKTEQKRKAMQSVAYDLRWENLFDMSLMFTHADLKAVKDSDLFHDDKTSSSRVYINGSKKSFGEAADIYAGKPTDTKEDNTIRGYINELRKSQPLLPVTKIPEASTINKAVSKVYSDGSTNIKGVYKDKDGLIIIKFNEVDDWQAIGFKQGCSSKGIKANIYQTKQDGTRAKREVETGNIKFFVHGLGANQRNLSKFNAFSLIDSDALLSASYTESPENKHSFFRKRGVIFDVDTSNIHGGGFSDLGSGYKKNIQSFKDNCLFGAAREKDRLLISSLIKKELNLTDDEYVRLVKENKNKPFNQIMPPEIRNKIIKVLAQTTPKTRQNGNRAYNEIYVTNPKVMGVFISEPKYIIGNPVKYLSDKRKYEEKHPSTDGVYNISTLALKKYALEHNLPMIAFGE